MPYSKDILELKRHLLRAAESSNGYFDLNKLIVDVRKVIRTQGDDYLYSNNVDTTFTLGGRYSSNIITSNVPFFVSGMSYGSLKLPAKIALHLALNKLAKEGISVIMNTGEG